MRAPGFSRAPPQPRRDLLQEDPFTDLVALDPMAEPLQRISDDERLPGLPEAATEKKICGVDRRRRHADEVERTAPRIAMARHIVAHERVDAAAHTLQVFREDRRATTL